MKTLVGLSIGAIVGLFIAGMITGCSSKPTSRDYMAECRIVCKSAVSHYEDESIQCLCK